MKLVVSTHQIVRFISRCLIIAQETLEAAASGYAFNTKLEIRYLQ